MMTEYLIRTFGRMRLQDFIFPSKYQLILPYNIKSRIKGTDSSIILNNIFIPPILYRPMIENCSIYILTPLYICNEV